MIRKQIKLLNETELIKQFSQNLFWDTDLNALEIEVHKRFIIQRVLEYGIMSDWKLIKDIYGLDCILQEMKKVKNLDDSALSFISTITNTPRREFRCYTLKQSHQKHWNF